MSTTTQSAAATLTYQGRRTPQLAANPAPALRQNQEN